MLRNIAQNLVLLGSGGHGRDVLDAARAQGCSVVGFLDDDERLHGVIMNGIPVLGSLAWLINHADVAAVVAVGSPAVKRKLAAFLDEHRVRIAPPIIHPQAYVSDHAKLADGVVVLAGGSIQPQVQVGRHVYISTVNTLGHDVVVKDFATTSPGVQIGGDATVGEGSFIGIGASLLPRVTIGDWTTVGAGAVVTTSLPAHCTAVGIPARVIKVHDN